VAQILSRHGLQVKKHQHQTCAESEKKEGK
jgi:hypothetical protein